FSTREYQKALAKLESLVVARLFELHKMGLSGTGYKLRTHINKALKTRCKAIQAALRRYNDAAKALNRQQLDWKDVATYRSLADFELLQECREDIRERPWAESKNRQAALHWLRLERAKEERERLNVEVSRLANWMSKEETLLSVTVDRLRHEASPLVTALKDLLARRLRQNRIHRQRIRQIYGLACYNG
ncbi:hypothetical protein BC834DRAFT_782632, partial [Gloeopeniophorella convolvens]